MKKITSTIVFLCAFVMLSMYSIAQDTEPNNGPIDAKMINNNMFFSGSLDFMSDYQDWYLVNIPDSGSISIQVTPFSPLDVIIGVGQSFDGGQTIDTVVVVDDDGVEYSEIITNPSVAPGEYYIFIRSGVGAGPYDFSISYTPNQTGGGEITLIDDFEDGDLFDMFQSQWSVYSDQTDGGMSEAILDFEAGADGSQTALLVNYTLNDGGVLTYDPFVSLLWNVSVDLTQASGISFWYRGPSVRVQLVSTSVTNYDYHNVIVPDAQQWTLYSFPWDSFTQDGWGGTVPLSLSSVTGITWQRQALNGSGVFSLDNVALLGGVAPLPVQIIADVTYGEAPLTVNFTAETSLNITDYSWDFNGDGLFDAFSSNPTYMFSSPGMYSVSLTYFNPEKSVYDTIYKPAFITVIPQDTTPKVNVTFRVDMQNMSVSPEGVFVNGSFTGWDINKEVPMYVVQGSLYEAVVPLPIGSIVEYKFTNGARNWAAYELLDGLPCTVNSGGSDNRFIQVPSNDIVLNDVCFASCEPCQTGGGDSLYVIITQDNNFGYAPYTVNFNAYIQDLQSTIVSWEWNFGDGVYAYDGPSVSHEFSMPGEYQVTLMVMDDKGATGYAMTYITAAQNTGILEPVFWADNYSGYAPLTLNFSDYSNGNISRWEWDFDNDGIIDSYDQYPTYTYQTPGYYSVRLTIYDDATMQSQTLLKENFIDVWEPQQIEDYCSKAIPVSIGNVYFDFNNTQGALDFGDPRPYIWYSYTAQTDIRIEIDLCNVSYSGWREVFDTYSNCTGEYFETIMNYCYSGMSSTVTLMQGDTLYFMVATQGDVDYNGGFEFEIKEIPMQQGDLCANPLLAIDGTQTVLANRGPQWYKYEPAGVGNIVIQLQSDIDLFTYSSCGVDYDNSFYGNVVIIPTNGDTVLLKLMNLQYFGGDSMEMKIDFVPQGELYADFSVNQRVVSTGVMATFHSNTLNATEWMWDFNNDGIIDSYNQYPSYHYQSAGIYTVKLLVRNQLGDSISIVKPDYVVIYEEQNQPYCEIAQSTQIGINTLEFINGVSQWYQYTSDFEGKLLVSFCNSETNNAFINEMYSDCESSQYVNYMQYACASQNSAYEIPVTPGQHFYFMVQVSDYYLSGTNLQFEVQKILPQPGDRCDIPIVLTESAQFTIDFNYDHGAGVKWYTYTATETKVIELTSCNNIEPTGNISFSLYSACPTEQMMNTYLDADYRGCPNGYGERRIYEIQAGETIYFDVYGHAYEPMNWEFIIRDYYDGEACEKPFVAVEGINVAPSGLEDVFYSYTPTQSGVVTVSNCTFAVDSNNYSSVMVTNSVCDESAEIIGYAAGNCGVNASELLFPVQANQEYRIIWYTDSTQWSLSLDPTGVMPAGSSCDNPIVINQSPMEVQSTGNIVWYEFTFPESGMATLNANIQYEASTLLFDDCSVPVSENMEGTVDFVYATNGLVFWPEQGVNYKLLLIFSEEAPLSSYTMTYQFEPGVQKPAHVTCSEAELLTAPGLVTTNVSLASYWYEYTPTQDVYLEVFDVNKQFNDLHFDVDLFDSCFNGIDNEGIDPFYNVYNPCGGMWYDNVWIIPAGKTVYIQFSSWTTDQAILTWELRETPLQSVAINTISTVYDYSPAQIDATNNIVTLNVVNSADLTALPIKFNLEIGNQMFDLAYNHPICNDMQIDLSSGSKQVELRNLDGSVTEMWTINVIQQTALNTASSILDVFSEQIQSVTINQVQKSVSVLLKWYAEECLYDIHIPISAGATIQNADYQNGYLCFPEGSTGILLRVVAENGSNFTDWTINYSKEPAPQGSTCENPLQGIFGINSVSFMNFEDVKIFEYQAQTTGIVSVNTCSYQNIIPVIVNGSCDNEQDIINPLPCSNGIGYENQISVVQGQTILIGIVRQSTGYSEFVNFVIDEYEVVLPQITNISLSTYQESVFVGELVCVDVTVTPFESSPNVAMSIQGNTLVYVGDNCFEVLYPGTSYITYASTDGSNISKTIVVTSESVPVALEQIVIPSNISLNVGQSYGIAPAFVPQNADDKQVVWWSSNPQVAQVDGFGTVTAISEGFSSIYAHNLDSSIVSNACEISVSPISAEGIILSKYSISLKEGSYSSNVYATVLPANASDKQVVWTSNDTNVVKIVNQSTLQAISMGTTSVYVSLVSNPSILAELLVTVTEGTPDKSELISQTQYASNLLQTIAQQGLEGNNTGQYPSSTISALQQAVNEATAVITNASATKSQVEIALLNLNDAIVNLENSRIDKINIVSVNINRDILNILTNETKQMFAYVQPTNATYTQLQWIVQNVEIATINQSGVITAKKSGITYVYAYALDGSNAYDSCMVVVKTPLLSLSLPETVTVLEQESTPLALTITPLNADVVGYTWSSDDSTVVIVNTQGIITGIREGIATVTVQEVASGISASVVVMVRSQAVAVTSVVIQRDSIVLSVGEINTIYPTVLPIDATNKNYTWNSSAPNIVYVNNYGVITAFDLGVSYVSVTTEDGDYTDQVKVIVMPSDAPVVFDVPQIIVEASTPEIVIPIANIVFDDNTDISDLIISVNSSSDFTVSVVNDTIVIIPVNPQNPISDEIEVLITDSDNQTVIVSIPVEVSAAPNSAPEFTQDNLLVKIFDGSTFPSINLASYFSDDYTNSADMLYEIIVTSNNFRTLLSGSVLSVSRYDANWIGIDSIQIAATDLGGLSVTQYIVFEVSQAPNRAPIISPIAEQVFNATTNKYPTLDLKQFVSDDYTLPYNIDWTYSSNARVNISIWNGVVTAISADPNWTGSTSIIFTATDEDGLSATVSVVYSKSTQTGTTWVALPKISFTANQTIIAPGESVSFTSSISGATSWIWNFEGGSPAQSNSPNPTVSYAESGKYKVKLTAMNDQGIDSLVREEYIAVIGINPVSEIACVGVPVTLEATVTAADGYTFEWNTGSTAESIVVEPKVTTSYSLTVKKGLFEYLDQITLTVPDTLVMPEDIELCYGDSYEISIVGFDEYNWNSEGWTTNSSRIVSNVGVTQLSVRDQYGCVTTDSMRVTAINPLPIVNLGANQEICLGTSAVLDATGTDLDYAWSTTETTPTISVEDDGIYSVVVTDANGCSETASVEVSVLRPHEEQIGVVTFGKEGPYVVIAWERTAEQRTQSYKILRETSVLNQYDTIGEVPFNNESLFIDDDADSRTKSYRYKLVTIDSVCENRAESVPHRSLHIQNNLNTQFKANLTWTAYEGLDFNTYKIYRGTSQDNLVEIDAVTSEATSWTDSDVYQFGWVYRIAMVLPDTVETRYPLLKAESGPYSLAMSNIAEAETAIEDELVNQIAVFPTIAESFVTVSVGDAISTYQIQIISAKGAVVYSSTQLSVKDIQISVSDFARGSYTLSVISNGVRINTPIVVK